MSSLIIAEKFWWFEALCETHILDNETTQSNYLTPYIYVFTKLFLTNQMNLNGVYQYEYTQRYLL